MAAARPDHRPHGALAVPSARRPRSRHARDGQHQQQARGQEQQLGSDQRGHPAHQPEPHRGERVRALAEPVAQHQRAGHRGRGERLGHDQPVVQPEEGVGGAEGRGHQPGPRPGHRAPEQPDQHHGPHPGQRAGEAQHQLMVPEQLGHAREDQRRDRRMIGGGAGHLVAAGEVGHGVGEAAAIGQRVGLELVVEGVVELRVVAGHAQDEGRPDPQRGQGDQAEGEEEPGPGHGRALYPAPAPDLRSGLSPAGSARGTPRRSRPASARRRRPGLRRPAGRRPCGPPARAPGRP